MPTSYSPLLGLALPVTGELAGTWGDTVNDYITKYLDSSVAGTQTISGSQTAVTLSVTNGTTLVQVGSGATGSAQYQVINCTGNPASLLTVTVPAQSKTYVVVNATSTSQQVKIVGVGPTTGVTLDAGEKAVVAWNGSDFIKVATSAVDGVSTISFGTTGLTPSSATSGAVTVAGTLVAANGGTGQSTYTTGDLLYATGSTALSKLGIGTNGQILTSTGTAPQWSTLSGVAVTTFSAGTTGFTPSSATSGAVTLAGTLATTNGGTGLTSFTANGVVYASSTSALTTGSALTFDGTNFAVGTTTINNANTDVVTVGKNSGTYDASIVVRQFGTGTAAGLQLIAAGDTGAAYNSITSTTSGGTQHWKLGGVAGSAGTLPFSVSGTEAMRLTSTGLGIGTSSPNAAGWDKAVTINGSTSSALEIQVGGSRKGEFAALSGGVYLQTVGAIPIIFSTNSAERMRLDSSGNLGLGVTPSASWANYKVLQIGEQGVISGFASGAGVLNIGANFYWDGSGYRYLTTNAASLYQQNAGAHNWRIAASGTAGNAISFTQAMTLDASGNLGIGTTSPGGFYGKLTVAGGIRTLDDNSSKLELGRYSAGAPNSYIKLGTNSNSLRFSNAADSADILELTNSGNLGLGVTPSTGGYGIAFQISHAGNGGALTAQSINTNNYPVSLTANAVSSGSGTWKYVNTNGGSASCYQQVAGQHQFFTAGSGTAGNTISFTQAMTLDASGFLGIGQTNPISYLDIYGNGAYTYARFYRSDEAGYGGRVGSGNTLLGAAVARSLGLDGFAGISFGIAGSQVATFDSSGNLGIGTSSPSQRLSVNSGASTTVAGFTSTGSAAYLALANSGATTFIGNDSTSGSFIIQTPSGGFSTKLTLDNSGNLGLGVTPSAWTTLFGIKAFDISNGCVYGATNDVNLVYNAFFNGTNFIYKTTTFAARYAQTNGGQHQWFTAASGTAGNTISFTQAMTLDASGRLGVGTTSPSSAYRMSLTGDGSTMVGGLALTSSGNTAYIGQTGGTSADCEYWNAANGYVRIGTNNTERARITSAGDLLVGTTSNSQGSSVGNKLIGTGAMWVVNNGGNDAFSYFNTTAGAYRFWVDATGTINATNTTISAISDQRFKENIVDLDIGLDAVMALKPRKFDWKVGKGKDIKGDRGFIAQEFEQVFPDLIDEWRDPAPEGEEPYKSVRQDLIPVLVKAIQEQQAIITDLRARVAQLEAK